MATDINRLRQQALFNDYMGPMNYMGNSMGSVFEPNSQEDQSPFVSSVESVFGPRQQEKQSLIQAPRLEQIGAASQQPPNEVDELLRLINQINTPEYTSRDRFNRLLDAAPERQAPSLGRTIAAAGAGFAGAKREDVEHLQYAPHMREMADWKEKTGPFSQAAQQENTANQIERQLASGVATNVVNQRRYDAQNTVNEEKNRIADVRARAYAWKQMHPDWDWDTTGPTYVLKNPTTGEITDTKIKTGQLGDEDLQILKNKGAVATVRARGEEARETKATPSASSTDPIDVGRTRNNVFQRAVDLNPNFAKWYIPPASVNGTWQMAPQPQASMWNWDVSKDMEEYNQARQAIGLPPIPTGKSAPTTPTPEVTTSPSSTQGIGPTKPPTIGATNPRDPNYGKKAPAATVWDVLPKSGQGNTNPRNPIQTPSTPPPEAAKGIEPGYVAIRVNATGEIVQVPQDNLQRALASGRYTQVK